MSTTQECRDASASRADAPEIGRTTQAARRLAHRGKWDGSAGKGRLRQHDARERFEVGAGCRCWCARAQCVLGRGPRLSARRHANLA